MARKYLFIAPLAAVVFASFPAAAIARQEAQAKSAQTITVESTPPKPGLVAGTYVTKAKASSGLPVSVNTEESPSVCSISGSTVTFKAPGICHVDFNQAGNSEWEPAPEIKQFVEVKRSQTITIKSTPPSPSFVGGTYQVEASASSGLAVALTSGTPSVCTVSGSTVSLVAAGTCTVKADQAGNAEYAPAAQVTQSFSVTKRAQSIKFTSAPSSPTLGGPTYTVSATATSGLAVSFSSATPSVCTVSGSTVSFVGAGTCTISANQAGNGEYEPAPQAQQSFAVAKRSQTIKFTSEPSSPTVGGPTYAVSATASSGLAVSFSSATPKVCTVSGSTVRFVGAGGCTILASQAGNGEYEAASETTQSFAVAKKGQTITITSAAPSNAVVGGATYTLSAAASSGLAVSFSSATPSVCTVSGSTVTFVGAGTCTLNANQAGNGEYEPAPQVQQSFAVAKGTQAIAFTSSPPEGASVGQTYNVSATGGKSGNPVTFADPGGESACTVSGSSVKFVRAGTCAINANQAGSESYEPAPTATQSFAVAKKSQTTTFTSTAPTNATAGGPAYSVSATASSKLPVAFSSASEAVCTVSGSTVSFVGAGTCTINAEQAGNTEYEPAPKVPQSFSVAKGSQTIAFTSTAPNSAAVGGASYEVKATGGGSGNPVTFTLDATSSGCALSGATVSFTTLGTCKIDANQAESANYNAAPQAQQSFAVSRGSQKITFTSTPPARAAVGGPTYEVKATGGASGEPVTFTIDPSTASMCSITGTIVSFNAVGTCKIDAHQPGNASYNAAPEEPQSFAVAKGAQTITFTTTPPSNATPGGPSYKVEATGGPSGNPVVITLDAASTGCAMSPSALYFVSNGECIVDANQAGDANYEPAPQVQQKFTIGSSSTQVIVLPASEGSQSSKSPPPIKQVGPVTLPNSSFRVIGASLSLASFAITFQESIVDPGTFSWMLTFENGKFGVYAAKTKRCKAGSVRLKRKCRPSRILFAKGSERVATAGSVTFTVRPTGSGIAAMKKAFKQHKGLPVTALVTFQSSRGGPPASRVQSLIVKGRR